MAEPQKPLALEEEPINPQLPICDAHHHLWDRPDDNYFLEEFLQDIKGGHRIVKTVFVGCKTMYRQDGPPEMRPVGETEFIERITAPTLNGPHGTVVAAGIISFADLTLGDAVTPVLEAHLAAGKGRFRGVRQGFKWESGGQLVNPKVREGLACLGKYGLTFDSLQTHELMVHLAGLVRDFPATPVIINHVGMPLGIGPKSVKHEAVASEWRRGIAALAKCPNVLIKLGGLGMPSLGFGWHERAVPPGSVELADTIRPYFLECIENFGVARCMFESNFPVDKVSYSYNVMWNAFKRIVKDFSASEQAALFFDNAVKVYRLE